MFKTNKFLLSAAIFFLAAAPSFAQEEIKTAPDGSLRCGVLRARLAWFDAEWRMTGQQPDTVEPLQNYPVVNAGQFELKAKFKLFHNVGVLDLTERLTFQADSMRYTAQLAPAQPLESRSCVLAFELPVAAFSGKNLLIGSTRVTLSDNPATEYKPFYHVRSIAIPMPDGSTLTLRGDLSGVLQDDRNYGGDFYTMRLLGTPMKENGSGFTWDIHWDGVKTPASGDDSGKTPVVLKENPQTTPVDIRAAVNMGWRDEQGGDRQGGWTDQGENDVRDIVPGKFETCDVTFDLIDPAANGGRSAMIFAGPDRDYFLKEARLDNVGCAGEKLYLLHALSWAPEDIRPVGTIEVTYEDGTRDEFSVESNRDVCNWWGRLRADNAVPAWTGRNPQSETTLYLSGFDLDAGKRIQSLRFIPTGAAVWMVAAVSIGDNVAALLPQEKSVITAGKEWVPFQYRLEVTPGSALDWSALNDAPAGKFGWVKAVGPNLEFEERPGEPVRFYGVNLCWAANVLDHDRAAELARRLAALGFNTVRIHHYDLMLTERSGNRLELDAERLDKIDYLIARLKDAGIYVTFDLYTYRLPHPDDVGGIRIRDLHDFRAAMPVVPAVEENFKAFARLLLTHENPYTGLEWRNDPAIFAICTVNENLMPAPWKEHPQLPEIYRAAFEKWCTARGITMPEAFSDAPEFNRFILDMQKESWLRISNFLRDELGVKAILTDNNNGESLSQTAERSMLDYVDFHGYWEHPVFIEKPWQLPHLYKQESAVTNFAAVPRLGMACRILGKPFFITEFDYGFPNHYRGEGGLLMGAYASFQNWTGLYRFAYSHFDTKMFEASRPDLFDTSRDPLNMMADRIGALLFRRFDVKNTEKAIPFVFTSQDFAGYSVYPADYTKLGLQTGIGSIDAATFHGKLPLAVSARKDAHVDGIDRILFAGAPDFVRECAQLDIAPAPENGVYRSDTGELTLDAVRGTFEMRTPRSEGFVLPAGSAARGTEFAVSQSDTFGTFLLTVNGSGTLADAENRLLFFLTDVMNSNITFRDREQTILEEWGELPLLLRRGTAEIQVKRGAENTLEVHALNISGSRIGTLPVREENGFWCFKIDNAAFKEGVFVFELIRKK